MAKPDLQIRNRNFLRERFPDAAGLLDASPSHATAVARDADGKPVDIDIGGARFYGTSVDEFVGAQMAAFRETPERYHFNPPDEDSLASGLDRRMVWALRERIGDGPLPVLPRNDPPFLIVVGLGLGRHVPMLAAETRARRIVVVEPFVDFLVHSLDVVDWAAVAGQCETLNFVLDPDPGVCLERLIDIVRDVGTPFIDGGMVYLHYRTSATEAIRNGLRDRLMMESLLRGWFEDEERMLRNAAGNFRENAFRLIDGHPRPRRAEPALVVGAGPSLTADLDAIARWRDHAVVFSAGTALQTLLGRGIVPDFHVEVENDPVIVDKIPAMARAHDRLADDGIVPGIRLIAADTVQPPVLRYFDERYLFLREDLSSTMLFGGGRNPVVGAGPLVVNAATAVAAVLGFEDVYLFGADCGVRDVSRQHAEDTLYKTDARFAAIMDYAVDRTAPANFGGTVSADFRLTWSRVILEQAIVAYGLRAVNCSDGARIAGAAAMRSEELTFAGPPIDRDQVHESVRAASVPFAPGEFVARIDLEKRRADWDDLAAGLRAAMAAEARGPEHLYRNVFAFLDVADDPVFAAAVRGTAGNLIQIGTCFLSRVEDPATLYPVFAETYRELMTEVLERGRKAF